MKIFYLSRCEDCPRKTVFFDTNKKSQDAYCVHKGDTPRKRRKLNWDHAHIGVPRWCPLPDDPHPDEDLPEPKKRKRKKR